MCTCMYCVRNSVKIYLQTDSCLFFFSLVTHMLAQLSVSMAEGW